MGSGPSSFFEEKERMYGVYVHVYSLTGNESLGSFLGELSGMPALHTGVEIFEAIFDETTGDVAVENCGIELAFGAGGGVWTQKPRQAPVFGEKSSTTYQESILIGTFVSTKSRVDEVIRKSKRAFQGKDYDLLSKNCNHYSEWLVHHLTGQHIPERINRLANTSHKVATMAVGALGSLLSVGVEVVEQMEANSSSVSSLGRHSTGPRGLVEELN